MLILFHVLSYPSAFVDLVSAPSHSTSSTVQWLFKCLNPSVHQVCFLSYKLRKTTEASCVVFGSYRKPETEWHTTQENSVVVCVSKRI